MLQDGSDNKMITCRFYAEIAPAATGLQVTGRFFRRAISCL